MIVCCLIVSARDLSSERQRHSSSVRQSRKLHGQVRHLGQELGQLKQEKEQVHHKNFYFHE